MPYKDPEQKRSYQREYKRLKRAGENQTPGQTQVPTEFRINTARDVLDLLGEQIYAVKNDAEIGTVEKARTIGYLCSTSLKAVELVDLAERVEALEKVLKERKRAA
jgi:hypothetical protein